MKLSIIVPVYNMAHDDNLTYCMDSLLAQTIDDYEIIAVDDKSTDNSLEILRDYESKNPGRVRVIASPENRRQGGAKNLGLRAASAEWVGFIDSDDWITPDYYEKLFKKAEETGADVVGCSFSVTDKHSFEVGEVRRSALEDQTGELDGDKKASIILDTGHMVCRIYKRELFDKNGLWFPEYCFYEDNCLGPLVMMYAKRFEYVDEPMYYYYQHGGSTTHGVNESRLVDRMTTMEYFMEECWKRELLEEFPLEIEYRFVNLAYVNTLFSYVINTPMLKQKVSFIRFIRDGVMMNFPDFDTNPYFEERTDDEVKKLTNLNVRSPFKFYWYYNALKTYRRVRYGKH